MKDTLKEAVDKQLAMAQLQEMLHIEIGSIDTPEEKLEEIRHSLSSVTTIMMMESLMAVGTPMEVIMASLEDDSISEEERESAKKKLAYKVGGPVVLDLMKKIALILEVFLS